MSYVGLLKERRCVDCTSRKKKKKLKKWSSSGGFPHAESRTDSKPEHTTAPGAWLLPLAMKLAPLESSGPVSFWEKA